MRPLAHTVMKIQENLLQTKKATTLIKTSTFLLKNLPVRLTTKQVIGCAVTDTQQTSRNVVLFRLD